MSTRTRSSQAGTPTSVRSEVNVWPTDAIERTIIEQDIRVVDVHFNKALDLMMIVLNTRDVLRVPLSTYPALAKATEAQRGKWKMLGNGYGVHWPGIDEHLSLKGFLRDSMMSEFLHQWSVKGKVASIRRKSRTKA